MIAAVSGRLVEKLRDRVVVATAGGVSYEIAVPLGVLERLPVEGSEVELSTFPVIREDGWALYGFDAAAERSVFQQLLGVTGVGPRLALAIVSTLGGRVVRVLGEGDIAALCTVPGVGKKTAQRIVLDLKEKVRDLDSAQGVDVNAVPAEQAVQALVNLGYHNAEADRAVRAVLSQDGTRGLADIIRSALQLLTTGS